MIPNPAENAENWAFDKLVTILLRQFKRLLAEKGVDMTDSEMQQIGEQAAAYQSITAAPAINTALAELITESETVLAQWGLDYAQALKTGMTDISGWETTADFLEIANEKVNAEVRISAGASLMVALGDERYAGHLMDAIHHDLAAEGHLDVDAIIAKKALLHHAHITDATDWLTQLEKHFLRR